MELFEVVVAGLFLLALPLLVWLPIEACRDSKRLERELLEIQRKGEERREAIRRGDVPRGRKG